MKPLCRPVIGLGLFALSLAADAQGSTADTSTMAQRLSEVDAVMGIFSHTRWPGLTRPLVLCVNSQSPQLAALKPLPEQEASGGRLAPVRALTLDAMHPGECDAVYLGGGPAAEAHVAQWVGLPVLTIGEGPGFCSRGGMFCLVPRPAGLRIEVNLDTVARSGLRVHPQVLKIGQPKAGSGGNVP